MLAIIATFFHTAIVSCRRWSNRWIVQKGSLITNAVSLSLGPYIIGVMQSTSIRSEMYPIWAVSLYTLFGCVDPVTSYTGLDYKGPLSKMVYQICFHCGYVLLMVISTMSSNIGKTTIGMLSAITFIKGFHTSLALVQQKRMRNIVAELNDGNDSYLLSKNPRLQDEDGSRALRKFHIHFSGRNELDEVIYMDDIIEACKEKNLIPSCYDASVAFHLSHKLHTHFLGINQTFFSFERTKDIDFMWAWKLIEMELDFLYDVFFSGNSFLHYCQATSASIWTLSSLVGICFVGVVAAIPVTRSSRHTAPGADPHTDVLIVDTNCSDVAVTLLMLASVALLQLVQLIRCWTSNWARVTLACKVAREQKKTGQQVISLTLWMRLREFMVTRTDMFDWYPWQNKLGQYSLATEAIRSDRHYGDYLSSKIARMVGLDYIWEVLLDLLGSDTKKGAAIMLDYDVKASIVHFLEQLNSDEDVLEKNHWTCFLADANLLSVLGVVCVFGGTPPALVYTNWVMMWHVVTCYCELAEQDKKAAAESAGEEREKNRRVATALSKYCAYLVTSVPDLLPGPTTDTKSQYDRFADAARKQLACWEGLSIFDQCSLYFKNGKGMVDLAKQLLGDEASSPPGSSTDPWKVLAGVWVRLLAYGTVDSRAEAHMRHLSLGGELITHLWAFMHHLDIKLSIDDLERYVSRPLLPHLLPFSVR
ncbi:hypothetical protein HU200_005871 [Digitaria exilis]|uniref:DUF4220 domain-containing protein n=1 Tax=Digitaria exilis TaxID=1010633 RepID=A0A835FSB0_9POAL|nr:hypothetical protein HU200_005871 [Digitaria exilis]